MKCQRLWGGSGGTHCWAQRTFIYVRGSEPSFTNALANLFPVATPLPPHSTKWGEQRWGQMPAVEPIAGHFPHLCARLMLAQLSMPPPPCHNGQGFPLEEPIQLHVSITLGSCLGLLVFGYPYPHPSLCLQQPEHHSQARAPRRCPPSTPLHFNLIMSYEAQTALMTLCHPLA